MTQDNQPDKEAENSLKPPASAEKKEPSSESLPLASVNEQNTKPVKSTSVKSAPVVESTAAKAKPEQQPDIAKPKPKAIASSPAENVATSPAPIAVNNIEPSGSNDGDNRPSEIITQDNSFMMWGMVLVIYLFILVGIGYISFWEQDFNDPENTIGTYLRMLDSKHEADGSTSDYSDAVKTMIETDFKAVIQEEMKNSADAAGDLQELASQSFNIVLGAVLAFLSATATMIFQKLSDAPSGKSVPSAKSKDKVQMKGSSTGSSSKAKSSAGKAK